MNSDTSNHRSHVSKGVKDGNCLELVVFDWSGTISDDRFPVYLTNMTLTEKYGGDDPILDFRQWLARTEANIVEYLEKRGIEVDDPQQAKKDFKQQLDFFFEHGYPPQVYEDAKPVIEGLQQEGKTLAVLSAHPTTNLRHEIEDYGLQGSFDYVVGSCHDKEAGLVETRSELGTDGDCLYVGDSIGDIIAAKDSNFMAAAVTTGYDEQEELAEVDPDFLAESLTDLKQQLNDYEDELKLNS